MTRTSNVISCVLISVAWIVSATISKTSLPEIPTSFLYPPEKAKHFAFGYHESIADLMWIRVIQDFDVCEQSKQVELTPHHLPNFADPTRPSRPPSRCSQGWVYRMVDTITELAPEFNSAYVSGATLLSVLVDDRSGALKIFEKGVAKFPDDWVLHYRLAYHYLYEIEDPTKAALHLRRAGELGGPEWTIALAANLYSRSGQARFAISILEETLAMKPDGPDSERLKQRLRDLRKQLEAP